MTGTFSPGAGDVKFHLGGEEMVLRPTLEAALAISRTSGGIRGAIGRVNDLDLDMIVSVVRAGIGRDAAARHRNLDELIWREGLLESGGEIVLRCIDFLLCLGHGGRPPSEDRPAEDPQTAQQ